MQDAAYLRKEKTLNGTTKSPKKSNKNGVVKEGEKPTRIVYQFLYNNNSRQQTEAR